MANDRYSDVELRENYGMRDEGNPIDFPQELGYRCPKGHANLTWSEFKDHIWCYECEKDFHYALDCVLVEDKYNPKHLPKQPRIIKGVKNWSKCGNYCVDIPKEKLRGK